MREEFGGRKEAGRCQEQVWGSVPTCHAFADYLPTVWRWTVPWQQAGLPSGQVAEWPCGTS